MDDYPFSNSPVDTPPPLIKLSRGKKDNAENYPVEYTPMGNSTVIFPSFLVEQKNYFAI